MLSVKKTRVMSRSKSLGGRDVAVAFSAEASAMAEDYDGADAMQVEESSSSPAVLTVGAARGRRRQPSRSAQQHQNAAMALNSIAVGRTKRSGSAGGGGIGSNKRAKFELPRWAHPTDRVDDADTGSDINTAGTMQSSVGGQAKAAEEDFYLRCSAFQMAADIVDRALSRAWADAIEGHKPGNLNSKNTSSCVNDHTSSTSIPGGALVKDLEVFFGRYCPRLDDDLLDGSKSHDDEDENKMPSSERREATAGTNSPGPLEVIAQHASLLLQPNSRDPTILPLALLSVGPSILDRAELVKLIHRGLIQRGRGDAGTKKKKASNDKPAVCILRGGPYRTSNTGKTIHGELLRDIVTQCIAQESHRSQYLHLLEVSRKSRFKTISYRDRLVEWASQTEEFSSIFVLLEDPEALSHRTFDAFMGTMTSLRACLGVPICLAIASIDHVGNRTALSRSSLDGIAGIDVKSFVAPPADIVVDKLMSKFFISADEDCLPVVLEAPILRSIKASFLDNNRSVVEASLQLKLALAHHFSQKGSFLSMTQSSAFNTSEWQRIAWFCVDKDARSYVMSSVSKAETASSSYCVEPLRAMIWRKRIFTLLNSWLKIGQDLFPSLRSTNSGLLLDFDIVESRLLQSELFENIFQSLCDLIIKLPTKDVKGLLTSFRREMQHHAASFEASDKEFSLVYEYINNWDISKGRGKVWSFLQEDLNSFIILFDAQQTSDDGIMAQELKKSLLNSLEERYKRLADLNMPFPEHIRAESRTCMLSSMNSLQPQVRRGTALQLSTLPPDLSRASSTAHDPVFLFQAMTTRVIDIEEWYEIFAEEVKRERVDCPSDILWQRFVFAVHELEMSGLVSRSRRRGGKAFEKNAMVWSSGS